MPSSPFQIMREETRGGHDGHVVESMFLIVKSKVLVSGAISSWSPPRSASALLRAFPELNPGKQQGKQRPRRTGLNDNCLSHLYSSKESQLPQLQSFISSKGWGGVLGRAGCTPELGD